MTENELSGEVIGAAIEVRRVLDAGLLETIYEEALTLELEDRNIRESRPIEVPVVYKGRRLPKFWRLDRLVADLIVVEVKFVERIRPVQQAQRLSYLRLAQGKSGLPINFNFTVPSKSVRRIVNQL